jgi:uracil-DNA glycosylase
MKAEEVRIEESWRKVLSAEFEKDYFDKIKRSLLLQKKQGINIFPPGPLIFNAYDLCPIDTIKVVIIGQDPYHRPGEAMGLSFSVPKGVKVPPSLRNIYRELARSTAFSIPNHGDLSSWATQGVFLLNAMLTVQEGNAGSHQSLGWQTFTDATISAISERLTGVIFLLWGRFAQNKVPLIDDKKHHILIAAHPSPLARDAFQGCGHFVKVNELLRSLKKTEIDWSL